MRNLFKIILPIFTLIVLIIFGWYFIKKYKNNNTKPVVEGTNTEEIRSSLQDARVPVYLSYENKSIFCPESSVNDVKDLADAVVKAKSDENICITNVKSEYDSCIKKCVSPPSINRKVEIGKCYSQCSDTENYGIKLCNPGSKIYYFTVKIQELCSY